MAGSFVYEKCEKIRDGRRRKEKTTRKYLNFPLHLVICIINTNKVDFPMKPSQIIGTTTTTTDCFLCLSNTTRDYI